VNISSVRAAHTFDVPDFGYAKDPNDPTKNGDVTRRAFSYLMIGAAGATYAAAAKVAVRDIIDTMNARFAVSFFFSFFFFFFLCCNRFIKR
jgi:hypothetical protein